VKNGGKVFSKIKEVLGPDLEDIINYNVENLTNFCFGIELLIGTIEGEGADIFQMTVCSTEWLNENISENDYLHGRFYLIMKIYDTKKLLKCLYNLFDKIEGNNWDEISSKLSRYAYWEFEDYHEYNENQ
jgi:hypothetical protein